MRNAQKKERTFSTSDLYLSAALYALGASPISINKKVQSRVVFIFLDTDELMVNVGLYWCKALKIEPQQLFAALKALKSRLYEEAL